MARKPLLDATSRPRSAYGDWAMKYRQSSNVEDRRGLRQFNPSESPVSPKAVSNHPTSTNASVNRPKDEAEEMMGASRMNKGDNTPDDFSGNYPGFAKGGDGSTTRKVSPEEAIDRTFNRR